MSTSPEPLIDLKEDEDTLSVLSNNSTTSNSSGGGNKRRQPPPPPPSSTKPPLVRSSISEMDMFTNRKSLASPLSSFEGERSPPNNLKPLPPPKPKIGRTISLPPSHLSAAVGTNGGDPPRSPSRSPPPPPLRKSIPEKPHREKEISIESSSPHPTTDEQATPSNRTDNAPFEDQSIPEGQLINLDSPPPTEVHQKPSLSSQTSFRRTQPISLPKPSSRELEYEEKEHPKNAFKQLDKLRQKGELCDCTLIVGDLEIKAHRVVLAACSSYFEAMFIGEFAEPEGLPIVIEEVDEVALKSLVDFAYTSRILLSQSNVYTIFESADTLEFQGIKNACFRFFKSQMNKTNCIRTWIFAESHNCIELLDASLKFIEVNFLNIVRGKEFLAIEPDTVCRLLELENIAITCEEQVYEAVIGWINYDLEERQKQAYKVLQNVRFPSINRDYLMHITDNEPIIQNDPDCLELIINAIKYHMSDIRATLKKKMKRDSTVATNAKNMLPRTAAMAVEEVELHKGTSSLGVGIMGGSNRPTHIFRQGDKPGIFIRDVMPGGAVAKSGKIRVGDRILSINGTDVSNSTHEEAIKLLVASGDPLKLLIRHEPPPAGLKEITLVTKPGEGFGFSIIGGVNGDPGNPYDETDEGIFISQIIPGGAAARDGRLVEGTRILQVNSVSLLGKTHEECLKVLQGVLDRLTLLICNGYSRSTTPTSLDNESMDNNY